MPIALRTPIHEVEAEFTRKAQALTRALIRRMEWCGEECRNEALRKHSYRDQTGNLTSSIGYAVVVDGQVVKSAGFEVVKDGAQGAEDGRKYLLEVCKRFPRGVTLVVVAGKYYASYVADRGYDVIASANLLAERIVPQMMNQLLK